MRVTLDSNILIYAVDNQAVTRHAAAADIVKRASQRDAILTLQSLCEFFHVATRKMGLSVINAEMAVDRWRAVFDVHSASESCLIAAIDLVKRHGLSFWDALLWATAREAGCNLLLSEDMHDGHTLGGVTCVNPFEPRNAVLIDSALPRV